MNTVGRSCNRGQRSGILGLLLQNEETLDKDGILPCNIPLMAPNKLLQGISTCNDLNNEILKIIIYFLMIPMKIDIPGKRVNVTHWMRARSILSKLFTNVKDMLNTILPIFRMMLNKYTNFDSSLWYVLLFIIKT